MKARVLNGRPLSADIPTATNQDKLSVCTLNDVLDNFIRSNLRGAMEYERAGESSSLISISINHTAYMLRLLLERTSDDTVVRLTMEIGKNEMLLRARLGDTVPSEEDLLSFSAAAAKAGFSLDTNEGELIFRTPTLKKTILSLYSVTPNNLYLNLLTVFFHL